MDFIFRRSRIPETITKLTGKLNEIRLLKTRIFFLIQIKVKNSKTTQQQILTRTGIDVKPYNLNKIENIPNIDRILRGKKFPFEISKYSNRNRTVDEIRKKHKKKTASNEYMRFDLFDTSTLSTVA